MVNKKIISGAASLIIIAVILLVFVYLLNLRPKSLCKDGILSNTKWNGKKKICCGSGCGTCGGTGCGGRPGGGASCCTGSISGTGIVCDGDTITSDCIVPGMFGSTE